MLTVFEVVYVTFIINTDKQAIPIVANVNVLQIMSQLLLLENLSTHIPVTMQLSVSPW